MAKAHERLQLAAAEMNTLRISATRNLLNSDIDSLSQQLSQIPADLSGQSPVVSSPIPHRSKRSRLGDTPLRSRAHRVAFTPLKNGGNVTFVTPKSAKKNDGLSGSITQDEEDENVLPKKGSAVDTEYGDLILDDGGFSQFDI
jgi:hypothetical protein